MTLVQALTAYPMSSWAFHLRLASFWAGIKLKYIYRLKQQMSGEGFLPNIHNLFWSFQTIVFVFIVFFFCFFCFFFTTCRPLYPLAFLGCPLFIWAYKWFPRLNHFYAQINGGYLRKGGGYSSRKVKKNNKDKDNSPQTLTDKNHQASSQKI